MMDNIYIVTQYGFQLSAMAIIPYDLHIRNNSYILASSDVACGH